MTGSRGESGYRYGYGRETNEGDAIFVRGGGDGTIANATVAGNAGEPDVRGTVLSDGHNVFGQAAVDGSAAGDALGADPAGLFTGVRTVTYDDGTGTLAEAAVPVALGNGGPTPTVALLDDPLNPVIGRADPATAPAADQRRLRPRRRPRRGRGHDPAPAAKRGAGGHRRPRGEGRGRSVPRQRRARGRAPWERRSLPGDAARRRRRTGQRRRLLRRRAGRGTIGKTGLLFGDANAAEAGTAALTSAVGAGKSLGLFLLADGADLSDLESLEGDIFVFFGNQGGFANVSDTDPGATTTSTTWCCGSSAPPPRSTTGCWRDASRALTRGHGPLLPSSVEGRPRRLAGCPPLARRLARRKRDV
ncbi:MAG: hypothetical protein KDG89_09505 [Geminicoccaceae bacterium]|nr:hypothetical protein [Geminicoccaceae bacterium]